MSGFCAELTSAHVREPDQCIVVVGIDREDSLKHIRRGGQISMLFVPQGKVVERGNPVGIERKRLPERLARLVVAMLVGEDHRDICPGLLGPFDTEPECPSVRGERLLQVTEATQVAGQIEVRDRKVRARRRSGGEKPPRRRPACQAVRSWRPERSSARALQGAVLSGARGPAPIAPAGPSIHRNPPGPRAGRGLAGRLRAHAAIPVPHLANWRTATNARARAMARAPSVM